MKVDYQFGGFDLSGISEIIQVVLSLATLALVQGVAQQGQVALSLGEIASRDLQASVNVKWLNLIQDGMVWVAVDIYNEGPDAAYVAINNPGPWIGVEPGTSASIDMSQAVRKIETIFYKTDPGKSAWLRVVGKA